MGRARPAGRGPADPLKGLAEEPRLAPLRAVDLPLLEQMVRAYHVEDGHRDAERQAAALAALIDGAPLGRGWLVMLGGKPVGYVGLSLSFSIEAGGGEGCVDELCLVPEERGRGRRAARARAARGRGAPPRRAPAVSRGRAR